MLYCQTKIILEMSAIKILILEDLPFQRMMLSAALEKSGYEISNSVSTVSPARYLSPIHRFDVPHQTAGFFLRLGYGCFPGKPNA